MVFENFHKNEYFPFYYLCIVFISLSGGRRRPLGSRRRQLEWLTNFVLLVVSVFGVMVGAGLLGFYKIHLLRFLSVEFFILPLVLLGNVKYISIKCILNLVIWNSMIFDTIKIKYHFLNRVPNIVKVFYIAIKMPKRQYFSEEMFWTCLAY